MSEIIALLQSGVALYEKLVGVTREKTSGTFTMGEFSARQQIEVMNEALSLDPSGITAILLLRYYTETTIASRSFSWLDLLRKPELATQLDLPKKILDVVESPLISEISDHFRAQLKKAVDFYDASERSDVAALLAQPDSLAFLRRDALRSMERLRVDQFLDGDCDPGETSPVHAKVVHQWWNINSMLEHLTRMPSGVSLNMVREPDGYSTYFAFAVRNGGRLFVLSDIEPVSHPLQNQMSRRPDRTLERRIARNWFPYDLLNLKYSEDGRNLFIEESSRCTSLAVRQSNTIPLRSISELEPETLVWIVMMFELILEKFWKKGYRAPALSYTGEMIQKEAALLSAAKVAGLPIPAYQALGLTPISKEDIRSQKSNITGALGACPDNQNQWMVDRYGDQCSEDSLNLLAMPSDVFLLDNKTAGVKAVPVNELRKVDHFAREDMLKSSTRLHQLSATSFGTKDSLDKDRIWLARHNWAKQVQAAANKEFEARKKEVLDWYHERAKANLPRLAALIGHGNLWRRFDFELGFGTHTSVPTGGCVGKKPPKPKSGTTWVCVMGTKSREEMKNAGGYPDGWWQGKALPETRNGEPSCVFTDHKASFVTTFYPVVPEDIAYFAGCEIDDLPDVLRHFYGMHHYTGNSILQRIDPAVSLLTNPWLDLNLCLRVGTSKRGMKQACAIADKDVIGAYSLQFE